MKFDFDPITHKYYIDGINVPSTTSVLPDLGEFSFLGSEETIKKAIQEGKKNHYELETAIRYNQHTPYTKIIFDLLEYYDILKRYPSIFLSEKKLYSKKLKYAGTPDLVLGNDKNELCIIDLKRSMTSYPYKHTLQLSGYEILIEENYPEKKVKEKFIVSLQNSDEKQKILKHEDEFSKRYFMKLVECYHFRNNIEAYIKNYK